MLKNNTQTIIKPEEKKKDTGSMIVGLMAKIL